MRIPSSAFTVGRYLTAAVLVVGACVLSGAPATTKLSPHEKAFYADPALVEYVQPGFTITVVSAKIAADGTVSVDYKLADPNGAPLDLAGVVTPGPISVSFLIANIPAGQKQFSSYITRTVAATTGSATGTQAAGDSGGTTATVATGEYIYTFKTKLPTERRSDHHPPGRPVRFAQPDRMGPRHQLRRYHLRLGAQRLQAEPARCGPHAGLQRLPWKRGHGHRLQRSGRPRRFPAQCGGCASCAISRRPSTPTPETVWI